jgi:hypothetical protein
MEDVGAKTDGIWEKETDMDDIGVETYTTFHKDSLCFTAPFLYWNRTLTLVSVVTIPLTKMALRWDAPEIPIPYTEWPMECCLVMP